MLQLLQKDQLICLPPNAVQYGFPKIMPLNRDFSDRDIFVEWLVEEGMPVEEASKDCTILQSRFWKCYA